MAKKSNKGAATEKVAAFNLEQFQALSPEEQAAYIADLQNENQSLKTQVAESPVKKVHSFKVAEVNEADEKTGKSLEYKFVVPKFHIDKKEYTDAEAVKLKEICAYLVKIGSGIVELVDQEGGE